MVAWSVFRVRSVAVSADDQQWKNKHEAVSAKKPKKKKKTGGENVKAGAGESTAESSLAEESSADEVSLHPQTSSEALRDWRSDGKQYTRNDRVKWNDQVWICRKSHTSDDHWTPERAYSLWKTAA